MPSKKTRFELLLEAVPDALVGMDQKGVIRFVNRQTESLFRYDRDLLIGQSIETVVPEPLWQIYAENRDQYFADPRTRSMGLEVELTGRRKDGSELPINISISHIDTGDVLLVITAVADVTRRDTAVRNAELLAAIVEYSNDAIIGSTLAGTVTSWNPAAERLYGYSSLEIVGRSVSLLAPEGRKDEIAAALARVKDGETVEHLETSRVRKDGTSVSVSVTVAPIHDENGVIVGESGVHRDVTEQKRARETAQRMAAIVEGSDDAIISRGDQDTITSWNPGAERMLGYSSEEMIGRSPRVLIPEDRLGELEALGKRVRAGSRIEHLETVRLRKDGTPVPVSLTISPIYGEGGVLVGAATIGRDVTEQRQALETAQRLAAIVDSSADAIMGATFDGVITSWNPAAESMFGYSASEIIGKHISLLAPQDARDEQRAVLTRVKATGVPQQFETTRVRKDGKVTPVSITVALIHDEFGAIAGTFATLRDLTEIEQSAQYARSLIEAALDPMVMIDVEGKISDVNEAMAKATGIPREKLIGTDFSSYFTDPDRAEEGYHRVFSQGSVTDLPLTLRHRDGSVTDVRYNASVYRDISGNVLGILATARDVTEQNRATETAQRISAIVESSNDAIIGETLDGVITSWNPAAARMFGYSGAEIVGKPVKLLIPRERGADAKAAVSQVRAGRPVEHLATVCVRKDGTMFPVSLTISPILDAGGTITGASAIYHDQTEIEHSAHYARSLIEAAMDPMVTISPEGKITDVNEATIRATGVPRAAIIGSDFSQYFTDPDRAHEGYLQAFTQGSVANYPLTLRHQGTSALTDVVYNASVYRDTTGKVLGVLASARDVTELRHAARYVRSLVEAVPDPLATIGPDGRINDVNKATVTVMGVPREILIGTDFSQYFTEPDKARDGYQRAFRQGVVTDYPLTVRHRDGTLTDVMYNASVYRDSAGNVLGVLAAARDMTRQRQAHEAAQRMAAIVAHSDDAIIGSTLDGTITSWNPAAERMYGFSSRTMLARSVDRLSPQDRTGEIVSTLAEIEAGRPVENLETLCTRKDGTLFPVKLTIAPIRDVDGAVIGASAIARDVSEQRRALAVAQQMAAIVEFSGEAIVSSTLDGVVTSWNPAAAQMFGYSSEELVGSSGQPLSPSDRVDESRAVLALIRAGQPVAGLETTGIRKDGTVFAVALNVTPIRDTDGAVVGVDAIIRDLTAQREALAAAQRMARMAGSNGEALMSSTIDGILMSWSPGAERMFGYSREESVGRSTKIVTPEDRTAELKATMAKFRAGQEVEHLETMRVRKDGTVFRVSLTLAPIRDTNGAIVGLSSIAREVPAK